MMTPCLAGVKDSVTMPILTVWVPYFELISGCSGKTADRILEDKVEIAYMYLVGKFVERKDLSMALAYFF